MGEWRFTDQLMKLEVEHCLVEVDIQHREESLNSLFSTLNLGNEVSTSSCNMIARPVESYINGLLDEHVRRASSKELFPYCLAANPNPAIMTEDGVDLGPDLAHHHRCHHQKRSVNHQM